MVEHIIINFLKFVIMKGFRRFGRRRRRLGRRRLGRGGYMY